MTNAITGTWHGIGTLNRDGSLALKPSGVSLTLSENGQGTLKTALFPMPICWEEAWGEFRILCINAIYRLEVRDDLLVLRTRKGNPVVLQKAW